MKHTSPVANVMFNSCDTVAILDCTIPIFQSLLTHVSRATKNTLNKLGVFTVSSFHAFICARSPSLLNNLLAGRGATKRRPPMLSRSNSGSSRRSLQLSSRDDQDKSVKVSLPDNQVRGCPTFFTTSYLAWPVSSLHTVMCFLPSLPLVVRTSFFFSNILPN